MREEDQRLLNSSNQEDRAIESEGGEWRQRRDWGWRGRGGTDREVEGPAVCQSAQRNDPLTTGLSQTLRPPESKRIHSFSFAPSLSVFTSLPPSFRSLSLLYLFSSMSHPEEEEQGQAPLISYLITLVMLHIIGKRWAK